MTGDELRTIREGLKMTQQGMADALKLGNDGKRSVRRWESGERPISGPVEVAAEYMRRYGPLPAES